MILSFQTDNIDPDQSMLMFLVVEEAETKT